MARSKSKKYDITWPLNSTSVGNIDEMFDDLYKRLSFALNGTLPNANGLGTGDVLVFNGLAVEGIADVAVGNALISGGVGSLPSYGKIDLTTHVAGVLPVTFGGTGLSTFAQGDLIYADPANTLVKLAKNTTATRYLSNTGTSNNPAWAQVNLTNGVTGTLPVGNGGTNATTFTAGSVIFAGASGTSLAQDNTNFFWDDTNNFLGLGINTPSGTLDIEDTFSVDQAFAARVNAIHTTATGGTVYGSRFEARMAHTTGTQNAVQAFINQAFYQGTSATSPAITVLTGTISRAGIAGTSPSGTIQVGRAFHIDSITNQAGGTPAVTVTTQQGLAIANQGGGTGSGGLTVTSAIGVAVANTVAGTNQTNIAINSAATIPSGISGSWSIFNASTYNNHSAGPIYMGHTSTWGSGSNFISFADGTVPATPPSNTAAIYGDDVSGTVKMFSIHEDGVTGQIAQLAGNLTSGRVALVTTNGQLTDDAGITYDATDNRINVDQVRFPATQAASSDANTLDDYEEGTWTPVITFATPGDLSVSYSTQIGRYTKIGNIVKVQFNAQTSVFTHTTASGNFLITGLPFTSLTTASTGHCGNTFWGGVTKAGYTNMAPNVAPNTTELNFVASGSGVAVSAVTATDTPTGGTMVLAGVVIYVT